MPVIVTLEVIENMKYLIIFFMLIFLPGVSKASDKEDLIKDLASVVEEQKIISKTQIAVLNGVKVESHIVNQFCANLKKTDNHAIIVNISHPDLPTIGINLNVNKSKSNGIGIFQRSTGTPYVSVADRNGDGIIDLLTYYVLNSKGHSILQVDDYGMDGQADLKINYVTNEVTVYYKKEWRSAPRYKDGRMVSIGDIKVPLKQIINEVSEIHF